jgi:hypothetical protein
MLLPTSQCRAAATAVAFALLKLRCCLRAVRRRHASRKPPPPLMLTLLPPPCRRHASTNVALARCLFC